jgi:hypothetical protein
VTEQNYAAETSEEDTAGHVQHKSDGNDDASDDAQGHVQHKADNTDDVEGHARKK